LKLQAAEDNASARGLEHELLPILLEPVFSMMQPVAIVNAPCNAVGVMRRRPKIGETQITLRLAVAGHMNPDEKPSGWMGMQMRGEATVDYDRDTNDPIRVG